MLAKMLEVKSYRAAWLPRPHRYRGGIRPLFHLQQPSQYFKQFQRNNGEIGVSFQLPILPRPAIKAQAASLKKTWCIFVSKANQLRSRIALDIHKAYQDVEKAQTARDLAQAELQLVRDQLSIVLAQASEGRVAMRQVEEAHFAEDEKWIAFFESESAVERARFNVLRETGEIAAALK